MTLLKNYKRIVGVLLCVLLLLMLCSCAKSNTVVDGKSTTTSFSYDQKENADSTVNTDEKNSSQSSSEKEKTPNENEAQTENEEYASRTLVVYFSCTGSTAQIASYISEVEGAKLVEIEPKVPYTMEDLDYKNENSRTAQEHKNSACVVEINKMDIDLSQFDIVYLGYPIWYDDAPKVVYTFLKSFDFSGKTIIPFCTSDQSGIDNSIKKIKPLQPNSKWKPGIRFEKYDTLQSVEKILK